MAKQTQSADKRSDFNSLRYNSWGERKEPVALGRRLAQTCGFLEGPRCRVEGRAASVSQAPCTGAAFLSHLPRAVRPAEEAQLRRITKQTQFAYKPNYFKRLAEIAEVEEKERKAKRSNVRSTAGP